MKILFIEPCYENFGGYFRAFGIAQTLSQKGIKVDLLCPSQKKYSFTIAKKIINNTFVRFELPVMQFNLFLNGRIIRGIISSLFVIFGNYEIIHTFTTTQLESIIPFFIAKLFRKKVIFDWDDYWQDSPLFYASNTLVKKYLAFFETIIPKYSPYMTVTSSFLEKKAKECGAKYILKIINGVDKKQFSPLNKLIARRKLGLNKNDKIIISFGNTYQGERALLLLETIEKILTLDKKIRFFNNLNPKLFFKDFRIKEKIDIDILKYITVTGHLNFAQERSISYLGAADLILFLMGNTAGEKACFPIRIGTYLNSEKVIATNKTDTQVYETLLPYNCLLVGENPKDLAERIVNFFHNTKKRSQLEKNSLQAKEDLCWDIILNPLIILYEKIIRQ